jgi:mono/diheme cytochrome c family protein
MTSTPRNARWADARWADARWADARGADARGADARGADARPMPALTRDARRRRSLAWAVLATAALAGASGCDMLDMYNQPRYKTLSADDFFADGQSARPLVAGTVARGQLEEDQAFYTGKVDDRYVDDIPIKVDEKLLERGRERYGISCAMCHGQVGYGDGIVVLRGFKIPQSFHADRIRKFPAGRHFEIITKGYQLMPPCNLQNDPHDRWAIVAYIQALQLSQNARLDDVPEDKRGSIEEASR